MQSSVYARAVQFVRHTFCAAISYSSDYHKSNIKENACRVVYNGDYAGYIFYKLRPHETNCCATKMADSTDDEAAAVLTLLLIRRRKQKRRLPKSVWVRPWLMRR